MAQRETKGDLRIDRTQNLLRRAMLELLRKMFFEESHGQAAGPSGPPSTATLRPLQRQGAAAGGDVPGSGRGVVRLPGVSKPMPEPARPGTDGSGSAPVPVHLDQYREYLETPVYRQYYRHWDAGLDEVIQQGHSCLFLTPRTAGGSCRVQAVACEDRYLLLLHLGLVAGPAGLHGGGGRQALLCRSMLVSEAGVFRYVRAREKRPPERAGRGVNKNGSIPGHAQNG